MITRYIQGDITETELKYIAHGVNCQNKMGSGVAKALYTKFPEVKEDYHKYLNEIGYKHEVLGKVLFIKSPRSQNNNFFEVIPNEKHIYNLFTQVNYGYDGKKYVNYAAIVQCFDKLKMIKHRFDGPIAIPKIGCGLAGGDWNIVEQLINDTVGDDLEIWVYELDEVKSSKRNDVG